METGVSGKSNMGGKQSENLGYLEIPDFDASRYRQEGFQEKMMRKIKENPFVPIGLGVTTFALAYGLIQMRVGDRAKSQQMMRLRVGAQGFTVFALLCGVAYSAHKDHKKRQEAAALRQLAENKDL